MNKLCLTASAVTGLMLSTACSNPAAPPIPVLTPPPARCMVLCPPMPPTDPDSLQTAKDLQDWGSDCRERQQSCLDWADRQIAP